VSNHNFLLDRALAYQENLHREARNERKAREAQKAARQTNLLQRSKKPVRA
jgi:hypothetical protein